MHLNHIYLSEVCKLMNVASNISRAEALCPRRIAGQSPKLRKSQEKGNSCFQTIWTQLQGFQFSREISNALKVWLWKAVRVGQRGTIAVRNTHKLFGFREPALTKLRPSKMIKMQQVSCLMQLRCCRKPTQGLVLEELQKTHRIDLFKPGAANGSWPWTVPLHLMRYAML